MAKKNHTITVEGKEIHILTIKEDDYFSLTDIAKKFNEENPSSLIVNWMRSKDTIEFLGVWEKLNNPDFNLIEFDKIKSEAGFNRFVLSAKRWVGTTNSIGIRSSAGRYGGTYAHRDIALGFCYWISPPFQLYILKEFQRLKKDEADFLNTGWDLNRQLAKTNWHIHSTAVREHLVPMLDWNTKKESFKQASEADLLNLAVFGMTAKEWKQINHAKKGNLRDNATAEQLLILSNLQSLNSKLLEWDSPKEQRLEILNKTAREQMEIILNTKAVEDIKKLK